MSCCCDSGVLSLKINNGPLEGGRTAKYARRAVTGQTLSPVLPR